MVNKARTVMTLAQLEVAAPHKQAVCALVAAIDQRDRNPYVTVQIDKTRITIIGGMSDFPHVVMIPYDRASGLKLGEWALCASAFKALWQKEVSGTSADQTISLVIDYEHHREYPRIDSLLAQVSRIYIQAKAAIDDHLTFLTSLQAAPSIPMPVDSARVMLEVANSHLPFDTFEVDRDQQKIRIERDHDLHAFALPEGYVPQFNMVLNKEAVDHLAGLCRVTQASEISCYIDDQRAVFSDGAQVLCSSLASLRDYALKKEKTYSIEAKLVINIFEFKEDIELYQKITPLKKANNAYLYIDTTCVMLASLLDETGSNRFVRHEHIQCDQPLLYRINLSEVSKVKISDITSARQMKICVLRDEQGRRKLAFYNERDHKDPYQSVSDIELATAQINQVMDAKKALETLLEAQGGTRDTANQTDLFGFADV